MNQIVLLTLSCLFVSTLSLDKGSVKEPPSLTALKGSNNYEKPSISIREAEIKIQTRMCIYFYFFSIKHAICLV
jgi:hypothetical protein